MSRPRRFRLWVRWALRDAGRRWLQVVSIGLLLALGVGMYSAMSSMAGWRTASADASFAALRSNDLRVSLVPGSYADAGQLTRALSTIPDRRLVRAAGRPDAGGRLARAPEHHRPGPDRRHARQPDG